MITSIAFDALYWRLVLISLSLFSWWLLRAYRKRQRYMRDVPIAGGRENIHESRKRFPAESLSILRNAYDEHKGGLFYVPTPIGERLMLPAKYLNDIKSADMKVVDFQGTFLEMFEGAYTTLGTHSRLLPEVVRAQLNQHIAQVIPEIQAEVRESLDELIPPCKDWTEINISEQMAVIIARVSSRMFGGTALSRNAEWIETSLQFAHNGFLAAQKLKRWPSALKPLAKHVVPEIRAIHRSYRTAEKTIVPLLQACEGDDAIKPNNLLTWMYSQAKGHEKNKEFIAGTVLKVSFAAYHTSAAAPTQLLFDLAAMPQYIPPLVKEFDSATRDGKGDVTVKGFSQMVKMDSVMKESQRFNPLLLITFERIMRKDFPLHDGNVVPANTWVGVPAQAITMDSDYYPEPEAFKPFRFVNEGTVGGPASASPQAQFVSAHPASMMFGYGQHACPGRFFAMMEIKSIIGEILSRYDIKLPEGENRPASVTFDTQHLPSPSGKVLFKARV